MKVRVQRVNDCLYLDFGDYHELVLRYGWEKGFSDYSENGGLVIEKAGFFYDDCQWLGCEKFSKVKAFLDSLQREIAKFRFPWDTLDDVEDLDPVSYEAYTTSWQIFEDLRRELFAKFGMDYDDIDRCPPTTIEI